MRDSYDYLIVGAGLSGLVLAERLGSLGRSCLVVEKRDHIGGNCHDRKDRNGLFFHVYGPHYFRTNSELVRTYLSRFTEWNDAKYRVNVFAGGRYWSFPINLGTYRQFSGDPSATEEDFKAYLARSAVPIASPANSKEAILSAVGVDLYEFFYKGYTQKQWGRPGPWTPPSAAGSRSTRASTSATSGTSSRPCPSSATTRCSRRSSRPRRPTCASRPTTGRCCRRSGTATSSTRGPSTNISTASSGPCPTGPRATR